MTKQYRTLKITTKDTFVVSNVGCYLTQIVFYCSNAGTAWTITLKDKASSPKTWLGPLTMTVPTDKLPVKIFFDEPLFFDGGIDVVSTGTTAGEVAGALNFVESDQ